MQIPPEQLPVAKIFMTADEFEDLATLALLSRLQWSIAAKNLWPADAFKAIDTDKNGTISREEFKAAFKMFGLERLANAGQIEALFKHIDKNNTGVLTMDDFKDAFDIGEQDHAAMPSASIMLTRKQLPELKRPSDAATTAARKPSTQPPADIFKRLRGGRFQVLIKKHLGKSAFASTWSTSGLSVWKPINLDQSRSVSVKICFGSVFVRGLTAPSMTSMVAVIDKAQSQTQFGVGDRTELNNFVDVFFPKPTSFKLVWRKERVRTESALYVWEPQPPSDSFAALGVVISTEESEPSLTCVRCAPRAWTRRDPATENIWSYSGPGASTRGKFWAQKETWREREAAVEHVTVTNGEDSAQPEVRIFVGDEEGFFAQMPQ